MTALIPPPNPGPAPRKTTLSDDVGPVKVNRQLRELFREAFDILGGTQFLVDFALESEANRRVFVQAISKLLPASANPQERPDKIVIDIPWLTRERLQYKDDESLVDKDVVDVLPIKRLSNG
jgi:hypothetical protein